MKKNQSSIVITFFLSSIIIIFMMIVSSPFPLVLWNRNKEKAIMDSSFITVIPFIVIRNAVGNFDTGNSNNNYVVSIERHLQSTISGYQKEIAIALSGLSKMLDQALLLEEERNDRYHHHQTLDHAVKLSTRIQQRIDRTATCLENDEQIITTLLNDFRYIMALPDIEKGGIDIQQQDTVHHEISSTTTTTGLFQLIDSNSNNRRQRNTNNSSVLDQVENHSYDSATQVMAHLVRDWTVEGHLIRHSTYDWCCHQVDKYTYQNTRP